MCKSVAKMARSAAALPLLLATSALTVAPMPLLAQPVQVARDFSIPAGTLGAAIAHLGSDLDVVITVDPALVRGRSSNGLQGSYTPGAALTALLDGTRLRAESDGAGGWRVLAAPQSAAAPAPLRENLSPTVAEIMSSPEQVVVVGALTSFSVSEDKIQFRQMNDLADLLRDVPSVSVGGSVGIAQKIYVRGLEDSMLNVTVDGAPQRGTLFHHIGRVSIEPELLKTVQVQTGAGEATAGFGAIGGAIRFRTKDAVDLLRPGQGIGMLAKAGYFDNDGYKLSGTVYGQLFDDVGFLASYVHVDRQNMRDGNGAALLGTAALQQLGFFKVGGVLGNGHKLSLSYEHRNEEAAFGQRPNWPVLAGDRLFPATAQRQTVVLNYAVPVNDVLALEATGYWTLSEFTQDRTDRWGPYGATITSKGFDLRSALNSDGHQAEIGVEYRDDSVTSRYLGDPAKWTPWAWDPLVGRFAEKGDVFGLYLQDHWRIAEPLLLSFGARYDAYDMAQVTYASSTESSGFSFNAGLQYDVTPWLSFNAGFAEAFRGKEISDAFTLERRPGRITLAPNLRPERVDNYEGGFTINHAGVRASIAYYNTTINDVILDQIGNGPAPQAPVYFENVGTFRAEGVELKAGYSFEQFSVNGFYTHQRSKLNGFMVEGYEHIGLGNSVGDSLSMTLGYTPTPAWRFELTTTHYVDLNHIEVLQRNVQIGWIGQTQFVDKPGYTVVDIFGSWRPFEEHDLSLQLAVYNLFNAQYRAHASVADYTGIPGYAGVGGVFEPGRNIRLSVSLAL